MQLLKDHSGIAFGYAIILIAVVLFSFMWIVFSIPVNHITDSMNDAVAAGDVSEQTASHYNTAVVFFAYVSPIIFLGLCIWVGLVRANMSDGDLE